MPAPKLYNPADYLPEVHEWIESGKTLRAYCRQEGKPSYGTVYDWLEDDAKDASIESSRFAHARDIGEKVLSEECLEIADTPQVGEIVTRKPVVFEGAVLKDAEGNVVLQTETKVADMIEHRKLRIETRLKLLAKWNPRKWGDKLEHSGQINVGLAAELAEARKRKLGSGTPELE